MRSCLLCLFLFTVPLFASDPVIQFPDIPAPVQPVNPQPVTDLQSNTWYIINSSVELIVRSVPEGIVSVSQDSGPVKIKGLFADAKVSGVPETRVYKGPFVYSVEAVSSGKVSLIVVPKGIQNQSDLSIHGLNVTVGNIPGPSPTPAPIPADPLFAALQVAFIADGKNTDCAAKLSALYAGMAAKMDTTTDATLGNVFDDLSVAANSLCPLPTLKNVREAIAPELVAKLGNNRSQPLDAALKANCKNQFTRMSVLLGALK